VPVLSPGERAACPVCETTLERTRGTGIAAAAALAVTTTVLMIPAIAMPLYRVELLAGSRSSRVVSGANLFWEQGWPLPAIAMLLFIAVLPLLRFGLLSAVLLALHFDRRWRGIGAAFRVAQTLAVWAMPEVMLLGIVVAYGRLVAMFDLQIGAGAYFMGAATVAALICRAMIDDRAIWRAIAPGNAAPDGPALSCQACALVLPVACDGSTCPRCNARLTPRTANSLMVTTALVLGGTIFYLPANLLPMAQTIQMVDAGSYTVLGGVIEFVEAHLVGLALLVFVASFVIPLLKLAGMVWLLWSVHKGSTRALKFKTKLHHVIHEIGRWSMVDVLAIGTFVPLMQFDQLAHARAMPGMTAFLGVVILTMFATHTFDTRLMWDARRRTDAERFANVSQGIVTA